MLDENMRLAVPLINRAKRMLVRTVLFPWLRAFLATPAGVAAFNSFSGRLPLDQKRRLFFLCAESHFRVEGKWNVDFAGRRLTLPLHRDFARPRGRWRWPSKPRYGASPVLRNTDPHGAAARYVRRRCELRSAFRAVPFPRRPHRLIRAQHGVSRLSA